MRKSCCTADAHPGERYYGNARSFSDAQLRAVPRASVRMDAHRHHRAGVRHIRRLGPGGLACNTDCSPGCVATSRSADKMTMANSLELRVPFLDPEVFAVASRLPADQKITRATTKFALRKALEPIVPAHVLNRPKLGFPVPIRHWLRAGELMDWAYATIAASQAGDHVDLAAVRAMLDEHRSGTSDHSRRLWTVLIFMLWHAIFVEHSVTPEISEPTYPVQI
jgi:asparagine synthase (glutamine-hydrolysing)